ncbi:fumarylacetoacetate hydrolase family protein [Allopusillimonas ginsengisoli]|uniref:fumarylacetoacetate hydrolase family protein n=1 Tax=Allopusillimonas ginsengisoli TaxID=453575 RepID=UPI0010223FD3|nr:fumarylacetoacetate hydrolase family protein [Allopusillimonas ginsengisoli]TEA78797.1 FAA hydrolase family protein [Allopusillimonas ginsengisoli]
MFFCVFELFGRPKLGGCLDPDKDRIVNLTEAWPANLAPAPTDLLDLIKRGDEGLDVVARLLDSVEPTMQASTLKILPPIQRPPKNIFCVGRNYRQHIIEGNVARGIEPNTFPEHIEFFTKAPTTITGHGADIPSHSGITAQLDYEAELAIVIGATGSNLAPDAALDLVFGYTIVNDITARDLQRRHGQWFKGKTLDGTCPIGPWVVHKSVLANVNNLSISLKVNGEVRQSDNTGSLIFDIPTIVEQLSKGLTLEPGDIIATGTPSGVGYAMTPPHFLGDGDLVTVEIEGIGRLENTVRTKLNT